MLIVTVNLIEIQLKVFRWASRNYCKSDSEFTNKTRKIFSVIFNLLSQKLYLEKNRTNVVVMPGYSVTRI